MAVNWQIASLGWDDSPRIDLNVNRREEQRRVLVRTRRKLLLLLCAGAYAGAVLCPWTMSIFSLRKQAASLKTKVAQTDGKIAQLKQMASDLDGKQIEWQRYQAALRERKSWGDAIATVAAACPNGVYLDDLHIDGQSRLITIGGSSKGVAYASAYVAALQRSTAFADVRLTETTTDPTTPAEELRFKIGGRCTLPLNGD